MKVNSKVELKLDNFDKCWLECDSDCPLGTLYDYSCALKAFVIQKMQEAEAAQKSKEEEKAE